MQREIFATADLWQLGSQCPCSGRLRPVNIAHWDRLKSQASVRCDDCGRFWLVEMSMQEIVISSSPKAES